MTLHPVLIAIPQVAGPVSQQVQQQRDYARRALRESARLCGAPLDGWLQDANDTPIPQRGFHWSISHKRCYAAAVVARSRVGIDIEHITPRRDGLWDEVGTPHEWGLIGGRSLRSFYYLWTAKESALKSLGIGLKGLDECRVVARAPGGGLTLRYRNEEIGVAHFEHAEHVTAITTVTPFAQWHIAERGLEMEVSVARKG